MQNKRFFMCVLIGEPFIYHTMDINLSLASGITNTMKRGMYADSHGLSFLAKNCQEEEKEME